MKKQYHLLSILTLFSVVTLAQQSAKYESDVPHQKTLKLDNPISKDMAMSQFAKMYNLKEGYTYQTIRTTSDVSGMTHERIQQFYKGIKVEFGTLILHSINGSIVSVNGELYDASQSNLSASITTDAGLDYAIRSVGAKEYLWNDTTQARLMEYNMPKGELVLFPDIRSGKVSLAYKYDIYATEPISRDDIYVDANTGEILLKNAIIKHANGLISDAQMKSYSDKVEEAILGKSSNTLVTATAATRYSGTQNIETSIDPGLGNYVLNDLTRGNGIVTYNSANTNTMPSTHFQDSDNVWNNGNYATGHASKDNAALDAHWGAMKTYDFWKNTFNRNSFDDANGQIRSYVHYNATNNGATGWDNAQWTGSVMRYGDGNSFNVLTSVDVIGHEIGHAICQYTANLVYANQSGAMNEGYSDIWGACIEQYAKFGNLNAGTDTASPGTLAVWKIGEQLATNPLRSMSYPRTRNNPDTFLGTFYSDTQDDTGITPACTAPNSNTNDNCGVHNNSGVLNHWFYILTAGKSGTNNASAANGGPDVFNVTGIGMTKSSQIAYYVERDYLTPNAKFSDARAASIAVASSLYCATSPEVQAVTNAWFAVNVGNAYAALANDVSLKSLNATSSIACGSPYNASIVFENAGTANISSVTISYSIDGGAATIQTWNGTLANCSTQVFPLTITGLTRGTHTLSVTTTITGDGNATNNTKTTLITVNNNGTVGTTNTFAANSDTLVSIDENGKTNSLWERGTVNKSLLTSAVTGSAGYATKLVGNYPDNTTSYLISQCYNLSNLSSTTVSFDMAFDLESNWDIIYFEYSTDSGATWNVLGTSTDPNWFNSSRLPDGTDCFNCIGKQWTGDYATAPIGGTGANGNKRNYSHSLASLGNPSNAMFRFVFVSDSSANQNGVFIDNFLVQGTLSNDENQFEHFAVYPNPSNGKFSVILSTTDSVNINLFDIRGRSVYTKHYDSTSTSFNQLIDLSGLSSGVYILNVESNGKKEARRIIIE